LHREGSLLARCIGGRDLEDLAAVLKTQRASKKQVLEAIETSMAEIRAEFESGGDEFGEEEFEEEGEVPDGGF
jgi:hypothetical protein